MNALELARKYENDETWQTDYGACLRAIRIGLDLSLREAAVIIGVPHVELGRWERGALHAGEFISITLFATACRRMATLAIERDKSKPSLTEKMAAAARKGVRRG